MRKLKPIPFPVTPIHFLAFLFLFLTLCLPFFCLSPTASSTIGDQGKITSQEISFSIIDPDSTAAADHHNPDLLFDQLILRKSTCGKSKVDLEGHFGPNPPGFTNDRGKAILRKSTCGWITSPVVWDRSPKSALSFCIPNTGFVSGRDYKSGR